MGKKNFKKNEKIIFEVRRQLFHVLVGLSLALFLLMFGRVASIVFFSFIIFIGVYIKHRVEKRKYVGVISELLDVFERESDRENPGKGSMYLIIGALLSVMLYEFTPAFYAILVISISDAFSTLVGKSFGRIKIKNKSFIGGISFFLSAYFILLVPYGPYVSFFVAFFAAIIESLPIINDNVSVPVFVGLLLQIV